MLLNSLDISAAKEKFLARSASHWNTFFLDSFMQEATSLDLWGESSLFTELAPHKGKFFQLSLRYLCFLKL